MSIINLGGGIRKARKEHKCNACYKTIKKGEHYNAQACVNDDGKYTWKTCEFCEYIIKNHHDWVWDDGDYCYPSGCVAEMDWQSEEEKQRIKDLSIGFLTPPSEE